MFPRPPMMNGYSASVSSSAFSMSWMRNCFCLRLRAARYSFSRSKSSAGICTAKVRSAFMLICPPSKCSVKMRSEKDVVCKPFKNHHAEQLKLVTDFDWIDFDRLSDVDELISSVLSCEEAADYIDEGRIHAITESVQRRIGHLQELAMTQTPRQLDTTEDDVREEVAADYAPKMEL